MMNNVILELIKENIIDRTSTMKSGEQIDCEGLFEPWVWSTIPAADRRHFIGPYVSRLVHQRKVPLEFVGFNHRRHNLYRKL